MQDLTLDNGTDAVDAAQVADQQRTLPKQALTDGEDPSYGDPQPPPLAVKPPAPPTTSPPPSPQKVPPSPPQSPPPIVLASPRNGGTTAAPSTEENDCPADGSSASGSTGILTHCVSTGSMNSNGSNGSSGNIPPGGGSPSPVRSASATICKREYLPGPDGQRQRVLEELYLTEKTFLRGLNVLVNEYLTPIKEANSAIIRSALIPVIFFNITEIEKVSSSLCDALNQYNTNWTPESCLSQVFSPFVSPISEVFTPYIQNYDKSVQTLYTLSEKSKTFTTFIEGVKAKPISESKDLAAYLITPIQRIPRYTLLIKEYLKATPAGHPDSSGLSQVCRDLECLTASVNVSIKQEQNRAKLMEIEKSFIKLSPEMKAQILSDHLFIREGYLYKECRKTDKKRYFWLFSDFLMYGAPVVQSEKMAFLLHRSFPVSKEKLKVIPIANEEPSPSCEFAKYPFQIIAQGKAFTVYAEEHTEKDGWLLDFNEILIGARGVGTSQIITQGAAVDATQAPVWVQDKKSLICMICGHHFNVIKRRHHCRNCGKIMCGKCCHLKRVLPHIGEEAVRVCKFCMEFLDITEQEEKKKVIDSKTPSKGDPPKNLHSSSIIQASPATDTPGDPHSGTVSEGTSASPETATVASQHKSCLTHPPSPSLSPSPSPSPSPSLSPAPTPANSALPNSSLASSTTPSREGQSSVLPQRQTTWIAPTRALRSATIVPCSQPNYAVLANPEKNIAYIVVMCFSVDSKSVVLSINALPPSGSPVSTPTAAHYLTISGTTRPEQSFGDIVHTKDTLELFSSSPGLRGGPFSLTVPLPFKCAIDDHAVWIEQGRLVVRLWGEGSVQQREGKHSSVIEDPSCMKQSEVPVTAEATLASETCMKHQKEADDHTENTFVNSKSSVDRQCENTTQMHSEKTGTGKNDAIPPEPDIAIRKEPGRHHKKVSQEEETVKHCEEQEDRDHGKCQEPSLEQRVGQQSTDAPTKIDEKPPTPPKREDVVKKEGKSTETETELVPGSKPSHSATSTTAAPKVQPSVAPKIEVKLKPVSRSKPTNPTSTTTTPSPAPDTEPPKVASRAMLKPVFLKTSADTPPAVNACTAGSGTPPTTVKEIIQAMQVLSQKRGNRL